MVTGISGIYPNFAGLATSGLNPTGCLSQYMEDGSLFGGIGFTNPGFGLGFGAGIGMTPAANNAYYNMMIQNSDNSATLAFVNRGNQHSLESYGEILMKNMPELATALRNGEYGKAGKIYDGVYQAISKNYGREITTHEDRLNMDQSIKATITKAYQQINGSTIAMDAAADNEGYLENGFMQGLTMGNHHRNCSEEIESYMTGNRIEGYSGKKFTKTLGKAAGTAVNIGGFAAAGAGIGALCGGALAVPGAIIGAGVGLVANVISWLTSNNQPTQVTEA